MPKKPGPDVVVVWPLVVYPLAAIGVLGLYQHSSHPLASEGSGGPVNWGRKLGTA